ncbi:MAG: M6 family metalloprotease domain-containing protein, partial [Muribaculaceae bacterium]|nr:M6 family metalloprotease domain-containing protein [Muribaculaceae bacterium]
LTVISGRPAFTAGGVTASPAYFMWEQPDGSIIEVRAVGDEYFHFYEDRAGNRMTADVSGELRPCDMAVLESRASYANARRKAAQPDRKKINTSYPTKGKSKALVILVNFSDNEFTIPNPKETYERMLNEEGFSEYNATGSARDYFLAASCGQFDIEFDVFGPITLPGTMEYYGAESYKGHDSNPEEVVINACIQLDNEIDFNEYDRDGDGEIDNVYVFYAGRGQASGGGASTIWPHSADVYSGFNKTHRFDGLLLNHYAMSNEIDESLSLSGIGTFCHEFSHVLGLPDFYATTYTTSFTCGTWSVMDYGPYLNNGHTPPIYSAYERYALGWLTPERLEDAPVSVRMAPLTSENRAFLMPSDSPNEYFIFENRQQEGWDKFIPGHGMLVWHIDYHPSIWQMNSVNNNPNHLYVDILEADGIQEERNRDGDAFPGTAVVTELNDFTTPSLRGWSGIETGHTISRIREIDGEILFEYCGGNPPLQMVEGIALDEVGPTSARARWDAVAEADSYRISLARMEEGIPYPVAGLDDVNVGNVTEYAFSSLDFKSDYVLKVVAENKWWRSLAGEGLAFRTEDPTFDLLKPEGLCASNVSEDGFTVAWTPMDDAVAYEALLFDRETASGETETVTFDGLVLPASGWTSTCSEFYKSTAYSGESVPSIKMGDGDWLKSPLYDKDIMNVSVWHRSSTNSDGQYLLAILRDSRGAEVFRQEFAVSRTSGGTVSSLTASENPDLSNLHARSAEFHFLTEGSTNLALDDVTVVMAGETTDTELEFAEITADKGATEWTFNGLTPSRRYWCKVRGINSEGTKTAWSEALAVTISGDTGIMELPSDSAEGTVLYDLNGIKVNSPLKGTIYVNSKREKVIIK